ncbi:MAG: GntR family transcriptional regulator [Desulfuromonadales bacterium]|nr:GntR family transcriptional regulator [Desulfuromonadales bacterium]
MLNPHSPTPLYHQLAEQLTARIRAGAYPPGSRIPSEHQLSADFSIGRPTVRQAIDLLVRKGLLAKRRGAGTFVCEPRQEVALFSLDGTGAAFRDKGLALETRLLAPARLEAMCHDPGNPFDGGAAYYLSRLVLVNDAPVLLEEIFLHQQLFAGIEQVELHGCSLSAIADEQFYLRPSGGKQNFSIEYPDAERAWLLQVEDSVPLLRVDRFLHFQQADNGFFSRLYCRTDRFVFSQNLNA